MGIQSKTYVSGATYYYVKDRQAQTYTIRFNFGGFC